MDGSKKILRVGILAEVTNLDPARAQDVDSMLVMRQVVEAPFGIRTGTAETEPALCTEGLRLVEGSDPQVYRARLRGDLKLSDGRPLTARDVAESLSRVALVAEQAAVAAEGDELVFTLKHPNARFDLVLSHPQSAVHRLEGGKLLGTGPFRIADDSTSSHIRLVRNPHYRGSTALDEIRFTVYPLDADGKPTKLLRAIQRGEVDFSNALARDYVNEVSGVKKSLLPGVSTAMLYFNTESPKLRDVRVRKALAQSIDRIEVARVSYKNALAFAASGLLPRSLGAADDNLSYDPAAAEALLSEPGVTTPDRLTVLMPWGPRPYIPHPQGFFDVVASQLGKIGVELEAVVPENAVEFLERVIAGREDLTLMGWVADTMDSADFLEANLASNRVPTHENIAVSNNNARLASEAMDLALSRFRADHTSGALEEVMRIVSEEAPLVPLAYGPTTAVLSFQVKNFTPTPLSIFPLSHLDLAR